MLTKKVSIDAVRKARKQVESAFENYRYFLLTLPDELWPRITPSYSIESRAINNQMYSTTENLAIKRIELEQEREHFLKTINNAVNRCTELERSILVKRYLDYEDPYDYMVYSELGLTETTYYRHKKKALVKVALMLGIIQS